MTYYPVPSALREQHTSLSKQLADQRMAKLDSLKETKKSEIEAMDWSCNGERLLVCSRDGTLKLWKAEKLSEERTWAGSWTWTEAHPTDPNLFSCVSWDGKVKIIDVRNPTSTSSDVDLKKSKGLEKFLFSTFSLDGSKLAILTRADQIHVLDIASGELNTIQAGCEVYSLIFDPENRLWLATGGTPGKIQIYDVSSCHLVSEFVAHSHAVTCFARTRNNARFVSGGSDALVALWNSQTIACIRTFPNSLSPVTSVSVNFDDSLVAWGSGAIGARDAEPIVSVAGLETGAHYASFTTPAPVSRVKWHPTKAVLAYTMQQGTGADTSVQIMSWPQQ
jgi:THO complex subunit 3